ncbi:AAA+-type ATPase, SpoVK/Ycf46/Vps4 family [Desulfonatronum zhilinae]|nr:AAA+-type ATPase, SpoVK/Ycf46/Vps4 family [Desulfonatronum zhilinae]
MRRRRACLNVNAVMGDLDSNDRFVLGQGAAYLMGVLRNRPMADVETLEFAFWTLGNSLDEFLVELKNLLPEKRRDRLQEDLDECGDLDDLALVVVRLVKANSRLAAKALRLLHRFLERVRDGLDQGEKSELYKNAKGFQAMFALSDDELALCMLCFLTENWEMFRNYFGSSLSIFEFSGRKYLLAALGLTPSALDAAMNGCLKRLGILERNYLGVEFNSDFMSLFINPSSPILADSLYRKAENSTLPLDYHQVPEDRIRLILNLLDQSRDNPTHVLLYGPAGTGKTSLARSLAESLKDPVYEILHDEDNRTAKRRAAVTTCLNMTNSGRGSVLIIDEADKLLNTSRGYFFSGETQDKGWLNSFMEQPGVRAIWIVNRHDEIEESVLRRFSFSLHMPRFSRIKRIRMWDTVLRRNRVLTCKPAAVHQLAEEYEVSAGVADMAVKQAKKCRRTGGGRTSILEQTRMVLNAHLQLENHGVPPRRQGRLDPAFSLEGLNIQGDIHETLSQLHRLNRLLAQGQDGPGRQFNLLFYGPPGTGKSELARYMARELDRDLMIRRASDLLDPFVGMTERKIAGMFAEAEQREAVLVVDEADSFIFGREMAVRSWETTQVNEFLTQMEAFRGVLICTTNDFKGLDTASVRRFNRKFHFDFLNAAGVRSFYDRMLAPLADGQLAEHQDQRLARLSRLAPGDFKNVRDRFALADSRPDHENLVAGLEEEEGIKKSQAGGNGIGF